MAPRADTKDQGHLPLRRPCRVQGRAGGDRMTLLPRVVAPFAVVLAATLTLGSGAGAQGLGEEGATPAVRAVHLGIHDCTHGQPDFAETAAELDQSRKAGRRWEEGKGLAGQKFPLMWRQVVTLEGAPVCEVNFIAEEDKAGVFAEFSFMPHEQTNENLMTGTLPVQRVMADQPAPFTLEWLEQDLYRFRIYSDAK